MDNFDYDAYVPSVMAKRAEASGIRKANRDFLSALFLSIQAGAFIALGAVFYTFITCDINSGSSFALTTFLGGLSFSLGLILVVIAGADLFTGDTLMIMSYLSKKITLKQMLKSWIIVFFGNLIGAISIALLVKLSGILNLHDKAPSYRAIEIAYTKVSLSFSENFFSGVLCNILVCLSIWLCYSARTVADKIMAIIFPISAFVVIGSQHSVANMYFLFFNKESLINSYSNLIPVTLGNIIGGAVFVGTVYWILYLRPNAPESKSGLES